MIYHSEKTKKQRKLKKLLAAASLLVLVLAVAVGTLAYVIDGTGAAVNTFSPGKVPITPEETFKGDVKQNVKLSNDGNVDAYIRAAVVFTWKDADGAIAPAQPQETTDYLVTYNTEKWQLLDGYWYCKDKIVPGGKTPELIVECKKSNYGTASSATPGQPEGYDLSVEILAQSVQAEPADAMKTLWKVQRDVNGTFAPAA